VIEVKLRFSPRFEKLPRWKFTGSARGARDLDRRAHHLEIGDENFDSVSCRDRFGVQSSRCECEIGAGVKRSARRAKTNQFVSALTLSAGIPAGGDDVAREA